MANKRMDFNSFVGKLLADDDTDVLREGERVLAQALMDAEVSTQIGAELYERTEGRTAQRNGTGPGPGTRGSAQWAPGSEGGSGHLLPLPARAPPAGRAGSGGGDLRGLREGDLHPQGR